MLSNIINCFIQCSSHISLYSLQVVLSIVFFHLSAGLLFLVSLVQLIYFFLFFHLIYSLLIMVLVVLHYLISVRSYAPKRQAFLLVLFYLLLSFLLHHQLHYLHNAQHHNHLKHY